MRQKHVTVTAEVKPRSGSRYVLQRMFADGRQRAWYLIHYRGIRVLERVRLGHPDAASMTVEIVGRFSATRFSATRHRDDWWTAIVSTARRSSAAPVTVGCRRLGRPLAEAIVRASDRSVRKGKSQRREALVGGYLVHGDGSVSAAGEYGQLTRSTVVRVKKLMGA